MVDTTPTQGLDKLSGVSRKSPEAQRDEQQKQIIEALYPLTGMTHEQRTFTTVASSCLPRCNLNAGYSIRIPGKKSGARKRHPQDKGRGRNPTVPEPESVSQAAVLRWKNHCGCVLLYPVYAKKKSKKSELLAHFLFGIFRLLKSEKAKKPKSLDQPSAG